MNNEAKATKAKKALVCFGLTFVIGLFVIIFRDQETITNTGLVFLIPGYLLAIAGIRLLQNE